MPLKHPSDIPSWFWFAVIIGGLYLYNTLKEMYDVHQLDKRLNNRTPITHSEECLVNAYHQIKDFELNFELQLDVHNLEFLDKMKSGMLDKNPPSIHDFNNADEWMDARVQFYVDDLKEVTERSFNYSVMLHSAYREYCMTESACLGKNYYYESTVYDGYLHCMKDGPVWSSNDWEYPIMWSLDES
jgi:hypothetical protein